MSKLTIASLRSIASIFAPGMLGVFVMSIAITLAALFTFIVAVTGIASLVSGMIGNQEVATALPWMTAIGSTFLGYILFPGIMPVIVNFFDSKIARLIEIQQYPDAYPIEPPFWPEFWHDLRFTLTAIGLNILVLPFYVIPVIGWIGFYVLNGHLLGKEFFIMAARRYMPVKEAVALRAKHGRTTFIGGIILTILATIPFLNLFAPFWGIAVMTHLYHSIKPQEDVEILPPIN